MSKSLCLVSVMLQRLPAVLSRIGIILASPLVRPPIALGRGHDFARYPIHPSEINSHTSPSVRFDAIPLGALDLSQCRVVRKTDENILRISVCNVLLRLERNRRKTIMPRGCNLSFSPYFLFLSVSRSFVGILPLPKEKLVCTCKVLTAS